MEEQVRWTLNNWMGGAVAEKGGSPIPLGVSVEVMPVAEHEAEMRDLAARLAREATAAAEPVIEEVALLRAALERIRDREWVDNALDPQWPAQLAREVVAVNPQEDER